MRATKPNTRAARRERPDDERPDLIKSVPFALMHLAPLGLIWTGLGWREAALAAGLYLVRMFFITAGYHRYFAHRSYKTGRGMQLILAFGGATAAQKGALWWAGHHRHHHKHSDEPEDVHSPRNGLWWSHIGWILCNKYDATPLHAIKDFGAYPELRWLDRHHLVPPTLLAIACWAWMGWSGLFAFFLSTALLYHGTFVINSLTHLWGRRRYATEDTSRNSFWLALITLGEGWHNNHHYYQRATNQGFFWWELDVTFYLLRLLSWLRVVRDLHTPPARVLAANRIADGHEDVGMAALRALPLGAGVARP